MMPKPRTGIRFVRSEQEENKMGFYIMILSFILGIIFLVTGFSRKRERQSKLLNGITKLSGIGLVLFAVWLGFPK
jgi:threonine/homoserine/homoserine lactone efflux protein